MAYHKPNWHPTKAYVRIISANSFTPIAWTLPVMHVGLPNVIKKRKSAWTDGEKALFWSCVGLLVMFMFAPYSS